MGEAPDVQVTKASLQLSTSLLCHTDDDIIDVITRMLG